MDFPLPPVGEGLIEVELVRWLVRPGDAVSRGQGLAEVMSDKATMEVPAPFAGTVSALAATPGTKVKVGQLFLTYEPVGDVVTTPAPAGRASPSPLVGEGGESSSRVRVRTLLLSRVCAARHSANPHAPSPALEDSGTLSRTARRLAGRGNAAPAFHNVPCTGCDL